MERYRGFKETDARDRMIRYEVVVPTDILEERTAIISAYRGARRVAKVPVPLGAMPYWDVPRQRIALGRKDESALNKATDKLVAKLSNQLN